MNKLDEEQLDEFKEAFAEFDKNNDGRVNGKELQALMRHMGTIQSDAETVEMMRECGGGETIDCNGFLTWMGNRMSDNHDESDLIQAFKAFDKEGNGQISIPELRFVLCTLGEKLDDEAVDTMLNQADSTGSGVVIYESFVRNMFALQK
ncbi:calmoduline [Planoprotostelium fungivorum]|uniref:Calmoduline n=1 Tax=Planoprotostelium fungivorum TaxID=1890364 RepID=A0A2P6MT12_9EUKA|nr:calmoduline [Planoprotostelium fungivorum]